MRMNNIFLFLKDSARLYPDKIFVVDKDKALTYLELCQKTVFLAGTLEILGVKRGDRVLIYLDNSAEYIAAYFAVLYLGAIVVPINKNLTMEVVRFIAADADPVLVMTNSVFKKRLSDIGPKLPERLIFILDNLVTVGRAGEKEPVGQAADDGSAPALILYTSGTTRMPKGVVLSHDNLRTNTDSIISYLGLLEKDSLLAVVNFCYSYGNSLLLTHTRASSTIFIENRTSYPIKIIEQLCESKATGFSTVGSFLNILLKQGFLRAEHLRYLNYMTFAGESTCFEDIMKLLNLAPHIKVYVMYGQTEASARLSFLEPALIVNKRGSVGKAIPGVTLRVVTESGQDVKPGEVGEVIASGGNIMQGYWRNDSATREVLRDGWLYTGDLAVMDEDGFIYIKGRKDDIIKFMGHRISPAEIEAAINSCQNVLESAAVAETVDGYAQIKAFIVPQDVLIDVTQLAAQVKKLLPPFKNPQYYEVIDALPRTASGKIRRSDLRKRL